MNITRFRLGTFLSTRTKCPHAFLLSLFFAASKKIILTDVFIYNKKRHKMHSKRLTLKNCCLLILIRIWISFQISFWRSNGRNKHTSDREPNETIAENSAEMRGKMEGRVEEGWKTYHKKVREHQGLNIKPVDVDVVASVVPGLFVPEAESVEQFVHDDAEDDASRGQRNGLAAPDASHVACAAAEKKNK